MREGGSSPDAPAIPRERLDDAVEELLTLGRERGEELRQAEAGQPARNKADIEERLRLNLKSELSEVGTYEDDQLVEVAWEVLPRVVLPDHLKHLLIEDLREAEAQLRDPERSLEGRGRLRRFVQTALIEWRSLS
jgi:hypothetical protein